MPAKLRVTLVKSPISHTQRTRATLRAMGLRRIGDSAELPDNPQLRGMARAVRFLVTTEELADSADAKPARRAKTKEESKSRETA